MKENHVIETEKATDKAVFLQRKKQQDLAKYDIAGQLLKEKESSKPDSAEKSVKKRKGVNAISKKLTLDVSSPVDKKGGLSSARKRK